MRRRAPFSGLAASPLPALGLAAALAGGPLAPSVAASEPLSPARKAALDHLLLHDCGSCHGLTMKGGLGPALTAERLAGFADDDLIAVILEGRPGTPMPPWETELSHAEAAWLVRRMRETTPP